MCATSLFLFSWPLTHYCVLNLVEISLVALEIQKAEFSNFTVPVNNTLECVLQVFFCFLSCWHTTVCLDEPPSLISSQLSTAIFTADIKLYCCILYTHRHSSYCVLDFICKSCKCKDSGVMVKLCTALLCPIVECNNVLWGPSYILDNQNIKRIQCKATRWPLTIPWQTWTLKLTIFVILSTKGWFDLPACIKFSTVLMKSMINYLPHPLPPQQEATQWSYSSIIQIHII